MIGPSYGEWWNERPRNARIRLAIVIVPIVLIALWALSSLDHRASSPELFDAVERGDLPGVGSLLDDGVSVMVRTDRGATLLHAAVEHGHIALAALLVREGVDVDAVDRYGITALHRAASRGDLAAVELLLESGADASRASAQYGSPLHWSVHANDVAVARMLLEAGAEPNSRDGGLTLTV